jgi:predicted AAA+ superfamily ATPase
LISLKRGGILYIPRKIESTVQRISRTFPALMVAGPRQSGKTTLLNHLSDGRRKGNYTLDF